MILRPEVRDLIGALRREIEVLRADNAALRQEVADLRRQLDQNSANSSKPPSSDGVKKPPRAGDDFLPLADAREHQWERNRESAQRAHDEGNRISARNEAETAPNNSDNSERI